MAFLFKSKKNQDRALSSRDGNAPPPTAMAGANARMQNEKHRATPTGSVNSLENDAVTTPERLVTSAHSRRGGSVDNNNALGNPAGDAAVSAIAFSPSLLDCSMWQSRKWTMLIPHFSIASQRPPSLEPKRLSVPVVATANKLWRFKH